MVRELVGLHGGDDHRASSEPDVGTTLTVTLPLGRAHRLEVVAPTAGTGTELTTAEPLEPSPDAESFVAEALRWLPDDPGSTDAELPTRRGAARAAPRPGREHAGPRPRRRRQRRHARLPAPAARPAPRRAA